MRIKPVIYRITSPSGKIYIGQTWRASDRKSKYKRGDSQRQPKLHCSFKSYGWDAHKFEIIHYLPVDCSQSILDDYEIFYIKQYKDCGFEMLNLNEGGKGAIPNEETKKRISEGKKRYFSTVPDAIKKSSNAMKKHHAEHPEQRVKQSLFMKNMRTERPDKFNSMVEKLKKIKSSPESKLAHSIIMKEKYLDNKRIEKNRNQKTNKKVLCIDSSIIYISMSDAARQLNIPAPNIRSVCLGKRKLVHGLKFVFI